MACILRSRFSLQRPARAFASAIRTAPVARSTPRVLSLVVPRRTFSAESKPIQDEEDSHNDFKAVRKPSPVDAQEVIKQDIAENKVFLYMKGTPQQPQCGFSRQVVLILNKLGVPFGSRNVLADEHIRQGIKDFSQWPTIPQLYLDGEFVGGCDIVTSEYQSGDLKTKLEAAGLQVLA